MHFLFSLLHAFAVCPNSHMSEEVVAEVQRLREEILGAPHPLKHSPLKVPTRALSMQWNRTRTSSASCATSYTTW